MARKGGVTYTLTCFFIIGAVICAIIVESHDTIPKWTSPQYDGLETNEYKLKDCLYRCNLRYETNLAMKELCIKKCKAKYGPEETYNNGM
ncbi:hypothetical protein PIB30_013495 [Stylosanthes scabra]|uniref:Uncharacterized protein n=1 Tax=Stylosanthes scabra TaxID=79078 RepID=A0ABU6Q765_9FABA|nr:hypothetical protein [Stylosanthes scabra]